MISEEPVEGVPPAPPHQPQWRWTDLFLIALVVLAIMLIGLQIISLFEQPQEIEELNLELVLATLTVQVSAFLVAIVGVGIFRRVDWRALGYGRPDGRWMTIALVLGFFCIPLMAIVNTIVQALLGINEPNPQFDFVVPDGFSWVGMVSMLLLAGMLGPLTEEMLFRGVLFHWLRNRWAFLPAALASSLIFGIVHVEIPIITATFVLGLICAWIYERSGSIWTAVVVHAVNNIAGVLVFYLMAFNQLPV